MKINQTNAADTATELHVVCPADESTVASLPAASPKDVEQTMGRAQAAQTNWIGQDDAAIRSALEAAAAAIEEHSLELGSLVCAEMGRPAHLAQLEAVRAASWFQFYAHLNQPPLTTTRAGWEERRPLGVVVAITPWNYPLLTAAWKLAPALLARNAVVLKPSQYAPMAASRMIDIVNDYLPEGLVQVLIGGNELGARLVRHPVPRKVTLTGSTEAGRQVAVAAAATMKRLTLELGGNDAALVLHDCDVDTVADGIFEAAFRNNGQVCTAVKRVYVPRARHRAVVDALADRARAARVGDGRADDSVALGPVANLAQLRRVEDLVERSRAAGAQIAVGGHRREESGYFYPPTVVSTSRDDDPLVREEQFGPAVPVLAYDDLDEAVSRANDSEYGLGGSVWGSDHGAATATAARLEVGSSWVNSHGIVTPDLAFGGVALSGVGLENGLHGLESFQQIHTAFAPPPR